MMVPGQTFNAHGPERHTLDVLHDFFQVFHPPFDEVMVYGSGDVVEIAGEFCEIGRSHDEVGGGLHEVRESESISHGVHPKRVGGSAS